MEFNIIDFKLLEVDGMAYITFTVETSDGIQEYNEMLRYENEEDISFLKSMETFIKIKKGWII